MNYTIKTLDQHLSNDGQPKRILACDGGGLRGILSLAILQKIEDILRERHGGDADFRLCHYFDLIAGTSTGAIIAATLATGWSVEDLRKKYMELGEKVFQKTFFRKGVLRAKYDEALLIKELQSVYGKATKLRDKELQTGLMLVTKRLDSGSPWPIGNNPRGKYFNSRSNGVIGNGDYPLWSVVRASTAAPSYFNPETITIAAAKGCKTVSGNFVDGGVSPFNNPSLQALMYATLDGYRIGWPTGADKLLLVSVGTGTPDSNVQKSGLAAKHALLALASLMDDCASLQETLLQWMSSSSRARTIDRELGDLRHDLVAGSPLLSYLRYNVELTEEGVKALDPGLKNKKKIESLSAMDAVENMDTLHDLGRRAGERDVHPADFPSGFDIS